MDHAIIIKLVKDELIKFVIQFVAVSTNGWTESTKEMVEKVSIL